MLYPAELQAPNDRTSCVEDRGASVNPFPLYATFGGHVEYPKGRILNLHEI